MAANKPDYILELSHLAKPMASTPAQPASATAATPGRPSAEAASTNRPWIAIFWKCCQVYSRVYRNRSQTAYEGRCPRCAAPVRATIGQSGTPQRFFEAQ